MSDQTGAKCLWEHSSITHERHACPTRCTSQQVDSVSDPLCFLITTLYCKLKSSSNPNEWGTGLHAACIHRTPPFLHINYIHIRLPDFSIAYESPKIKCAPKLAARPVTKVKVPNMSLTVVKTTERGRDCIQSWGLLPKPLLNDLFLIKASTHTLDHPWQHPYSIVQQACCN